MSTIFTQIIKKKLPAFIVAEDDHHIAFLDMAPIHKGHTLVVPKEEVGYFFDLHEDRIASLMAFAKKVAQALEQVVPCKRIAMAVLGLEVAHVHIHLIPLSKAREFQFTDRKIQLSKSEMQRIAQQIADLFNKRS
ncbi:MAG: HIT family protein [Bacteroidota bacterium]